MFLCTRLHVHVHELQDYIVHVYGLGFVDYLITCACVLVAIDSNFLFYVVDLSNLIILVCFMSPVVFCGVTD